MLKMAENFPKWPNFIQISHKIPTMPISAKLDEIRPKMTTGLVQNAF
jgi:hypothetical protein